MKRLKVILSLFSLFTVYVLEAQLLTSVDLSQRFQKYVSVNLREEIFLHTDRDKFIAGEDIWFSIYAIDRQSGRLSSRSSVAYVELINPWNVPVFQSRLLLSGGRGQGSFLLPDSLSSGAYTIRAYTNWMKNFFPENCFNSEIDIYNPFRNTGFRRKADITAGNDKALNISFFPEGGTLLAGVTNRVVAKCVNQYGEGFPFAGTVMDNSGDSVTCFKADLSGYGGFSILPEPGKNYSVNVNGETFHLQDAVKDGLSLIIDNSVKSWVEILITAAGSFVLPSSNMYHFIIQANGQINYLADLKVNEIFTKISVPRTRLQSGINQFVLIRHDGKLMFERSVYSPPLQTRSNERIADSIYGRREKVTLNLGNEAGKQRNITDYSISVTYEGSSSILQGIHDFMVFGTEYGRLPGAIREKPISELDPSLIDNFLICSESSWIDWHKIIAEQPVPGKYLAESDGHQLGVNLRYRDETLQDSSDILYMSVKGKVADFMYARREPTGIYNFFLPVDSLTRNLIIQPAITSGNMVLEIEPSFPWILNENHVYQDMLQDPELKLFSELSFNYQAARIYNTKFKKVPEKSDDRYLNKRRFYGIPEIEIYLDDYIKLPVMQEVFFELIPGVVLRTRGSGYEIRVVNPMTGLYYEEAPLVMIDGVIINDLNVFAEFDPELVERIEVVKTPYLINDLILHGIVNVITQAGNFSNVIMPDYATELPYRVLDGTSRFLCPDYSDPEILSSRIPDLRNTLYWNPSIRTSEKIPAKISFWTSDCPGIYSISIQGITGTGEKISTTEVFRVR